MFRRALIIVILLIPIEIGSSGCGCDLEITTHALPDAFVGGNYSFELDSDCGGDEWFLSSGLLPPGIGLQSDGDLHGVPIQAGIFLFTIGVFDFHGDEAFRGFSLTVHEPPPLPTASPTPSASA